MKIVSLVIDEKAQRLLARDEDGNVWFRDLYFVGDAVDRSRWIFLGQPSEEDMDPGAGDEEGS